MNEKFITLGKVFIFLGFLGLSLMIDWSFLPQMARPFILLGAGVLLIALGLGAGKLTGLGGEIVKIASLALVAVMLGAVFPPFPSPTGVEVDLGEYPCPKGLTITTTSFDVRVTTGKGDKVTVKGVAPEDLAGELGSYLKVTEAEGTLSIYLEETWRFKWPWGPRVLEVTVPEGCTLTSLRVKTTSGDVEVEVSSDELYVDSTSGDVEVRGDYSTLRVDTTSGDVMLDASLTDGSVTSVSGDLEMTIRGRGSLRVDTTSGDVMLKVMSGSLTLEGSSVSGMISVKGEKSLRGKEVSVNMGQGEGFRVVVSTISGDVEVEHLTDHQG